VTIDEFSRIVYKLNSCLKRDSDGKSTISAGTGREFHTLTTRSLTMMTER